MRKFAAAALPVLVLSVLSGCPGGPPGPAGPTVSNAERLASLNHVQDMLKSFKFDGDPDKTDQLAAMLRGMPDFKSVDVEDNTITAQFADGECVMIFNNRPGANAPPTTPRRKIADPDFASAASAERASRALKSIDFRLAQSVNGDAVQRIPESKKAVVVNTMGSVYCDLTPLIGGWLSQSGYSVSNLSGSIEDFRREIKDVAVLYYNGHGDVLPASSLAQGLPPAPGGKRHFGLWTRTLVTADTMDSYRDEVRSGRLSYTFATTDRIEGSKDCEDHTGEVTVEEMRFFITELFIQDNWTFKPGGLAYIDACHGTQDDSSLPLILTGPPVNASIMVGWDGAVLDAYTTPSAKYFFDRLLGTNQVPPSNDPPLRPFSVDETLKAMQSLDRLGLPLSEAKGYKGIFVTNPPPPAPPVIVPVYDLIAIHKSDTADVMLRPGVKSLTVAEGQGTISLRGAFGDRQGTATIDGAALAVKSWKSDRIDCDIADGQSGKVIVNVEDRVSNPRRLTLWNLSMHRLFMDFDTQANTPCPSCFYEGTVHYSFRADTGGVRDTPEGPVSPPGYIGGATDGGIDITNAGGTFNIGQGSSITLAPKPDDGAAFIGTCVGFNPPFDNNFIGACFFLDGQSQTIRFSPTYIALGLYRNYHGGTYDGIVDPYGVFYYGNMEENTLLLSYTPNFNIPSGQQSTGPHSYFQWEAANAISPDDPSEAK